MRHQTCQNRESRFQLVADIGRIALALNRPQFSHPPPPCRAHSGKRSYQTSFDVPIASSGPRLSCRGCCPCFPSASHRVGRTVVWRRFNLRRLRFRHPDGELTKLGFPRGPLVRQRCANHQVKELVPSRDESTESKGFTRESNLLREYIHPSVVNSRGGPL